MKFWIMICLNLYFRVINFVDSFCCFIFVDDCSVLFDNLVNEEKMVFIFIDINFDFVNKIVLSYFNWWWFNLGKIEIVW